MAQPRDDCNGNGIDDATELATNALVGKWYNDCGSGYSNCPGPFTPFLPINLIATKFDILNMRRSDGTMVFPDFWCTYDGPGTNCDQPLPCITPCNSQHFSAIWTGGLVVPSDTTVTGFQVSSDPGGGGNASTYIDGVNRRSTNGDNTGTFALTLAPGTTHHILVKFWCEGAGDGTLRYILSYTTDGSTYNIVPASWYRGAYDGNNNGQIDICEFGDCDNNGIPDNMDLANGGADCNGDGTLDVCQLAGGDCNGNSLLDVCELSAGNGLVGSYYKPTSQNYGSGTFPAAGYLGTRVDTLVNQGNVFNFDKNVVPFWQIPFVPNDDPGYDTSVKWTGYINLPASETYTFYVNANDRVRVTVNGTLIGNFWSGTCCTELTCTPIALTAGLRPIKIEYGDWGNDTNIWLKWASPSVAKDFVPRSVLRPNKGDLIGPGGVPGADGIPDECQETGACCYANYTCTDGLTVFQCAGNWLGVGTDCGDCPPEPTGACCDQVTGVCNDNVGILSCNGSTQTFSQNTLCSELSPACGSQPAPGDFAIVKFQSDDPDIIQFVAMKAYSAGFNLRFTDSGWRTDPSPQRFRTGEGGMRWTAPEGGIPAGKVVTIQGGGAATPTTNFGTVVNDNTGPTGTTYRGLGTGSYALATADDQVFAFVWTPTNTTSLLYGFSNNANAWTNATNANTSGLPGTLSDGTTAHAVPSTDNWCYNGIKTGTRDELLAAIGTDANWTSSNNIQTGCNITDFTVIPLGACCDNGVGGSWACTSNQRQDVCVAAGKLFLGENSLCANCPPQPATGACCYDDPWYPTGNRYLCAGGDTAAQCAARANGQFHEGETCEQAACPVAPVGACCNGAPLYDCSVNVTEKACVTGGGTWQGEGSPCGNCPVRKGACCDTINQACVDNVEAVNCVGPGLTFSVDLNCCSITCETGTKGSGNPGCPKVITQAQATAGFNSHGYLDNDQDCDWPGGDNDPNGDLFYQFTCEEGGLYYFGMCEPGSPDVNNTYIRVLVGGSGPCPGSYDYQLFNQDSWGDWNFAFNCPNMNDPNRYEPLDAGTNYWIAIGSRHWSDGHPNGQYWFTLKKADMTVLGQCCKFDGGNDNTKCLLSTAEQCVSTEWDPKHFSGVGTSCPGDPHDPARCELFGACCLGPTPTGCLIKVESDCVSAGGIWIAGTYGPPNNSPNCSQCALLGTCCVDGGCTMTLQAACSGTWTLGGSCDPNPCTPQTGACCNATTGACSITTAAACSGTFLGVGTVCVPPNRCCVTLGDLSGDTFVNGADIQGFVDSCMGTYNACGDFNGDGFVNEADVVPFVNALLQ
jgi:hypothetical protein